MRTMSSDAAPTTEGNEGLIMAFLHSAVGDTQPMNLFVLV
jgi:hypothetical protein